MGASRSLYERIYLSSSITIVYCPPQVTTAVREITAADYDAALRASPGACPLLCVAGDGRGGAELLAGLVRDGQLGATVTVEEVFNKTY